MTTYTLVTPYDMSDPNSYSPQGLPGASDTVNAPDGGTLTGSLSIEGLDLGAGSIVIVWASLDRFQSASRCAVKIGVWQAR
jgi:hypothetical protein